MESQKFVAALAQAKCKNPTENVFNNIWNSYEQVVLYSLITTFGLDFLVQDQRGGNVDSIRSVRDTSIAIEDRYKSDSHREAYENRGAYNSKACHSDSRYREIVQSARHEFNEHGTLIEDAYVPGNTVVPNRSSELGAGRRANLDHVISAHEIHEDPGRVLAGLDGKDLANSPDNLRFTNESLNKSKRDLTVDAFLTQKGDALSNDVQQQMRQVDEDARRSYNIKLAKVYYSSNDFWGDAIAAAGACGIEMGIRQALGFVFVEMWFACKESILAVPDNSEMKAYCIALATGVRNSLDSVVEKRKGLLESFGMGFVAGSLSNLTTTICNIFFDISEKAVRNLRQVYAAIVQAANVLLFNPNDLLLGDRIETATILLGTGASVLVGSVAGDAIAKTPLGTSPIIGIPLRNFSSTLVSGLISCTMLLCLDRSKFINKAIITLNQHLSTDQSFRQVSADFERYAAQIAGVDVTAFRKDAECFQNVADEIYMTDTDNEEKLNEILVTAYEDLSLPLPWSGDFDAFMRNPNNRLVFG